MSNSPRASQTFTLPADARAAEDLIRFANPNAHIERHPRFGAMELTVHVEDAPQVEDAEAVWAFYHNAETVAVWNSPWSSLYKP